MDGGGWVDGWNPTPCRKAKILWRLHGPSGAQAEPSGSLPPQSSVLTEASPRSLTGVCCSSLLSLTLPMLHSGSVKGRQCHHLGFTGDTKVLVLTSGYVSVSLSLG